MVGELKSRLSNSTARNKRLLSVVVSKMEAREMSEELDYHITFPSPIPDSNSDSDDTELLEPISTQREPVVVLLGWMGGHDKHLAKYSAIYEQKKCITIRYTVSAAKVFSSSSLRPMAFRILEMIEDLSLEESPILFHVMSNGGGLIYSHITDILHSHPNFKHFKVQGVVFDSCPSERKPSTAIRAYFATLKGNTIMTYLLTFLFAVYLYSKVLFGPIGRIFGWSSTSTDDFYSKMAEDPLRCPQLFLYSKADKLIDYRDVDYIIDVRRSKDVLVMSLCWEDSEHVSHLRQHRETYMKQCHDFLDLCLSAEDLLGIEKSFH